MIMKLHVKKDFYGDYVSRDIDMISDLGSP